MMWEKLNLKNILSLFEKKSIFFKFDKKLHKNSEMLILNILVKTKK